MGRYLDQVLASELSQMTRYYDHLIQWRPLAHDSGAVLGEAFAEKKITTQDLDEIRMIQTSRDVRTAILLKGNLNHDTDIQKSLRDLHSVLGRGSRIFAISYNPYLSWVFRMGNFLGLRSGELPHTFLTRTDLANLCKISQYEVILIKPTAYVPWKLLGIGSWLNRIMPLIPLLRWISLSTVIILRPLGIKDESHPSLSVIVPARNEKGNIQPLIERLGNLHLKMEVIFIEGHSQDGTYEEIIRVAHAGHPNLSIQYAQQPGKGKADAVRCGINLSKNDLITILDADLSMPPEMLPRFYHAYTAGYADFINGSRLLYPLEGNSMQFLNRIGNAFFAKALGLVLDCKISDSLCGTKLFSRSDYNRMTRWREQFGDFDPFGDFELLFPAAILGFGIVDIPICYKARTYGSTNIHRFAHGFQLLRMTLIGLIRVKSGKAP